MEITKKWLEQNAYGDSYARGNSYRTLVRKLTKNGYRYTAKVEGSSTYNVAITTLPDSIRTHCSCPYDYGGICKHIVAVGLNIMAGDFKTLAMEDTAFQVLDKNILPDEPIDSDTFYDDVFLGAKKAKQEAFMRGLFAQDALMCQRFLAYIRPPIPKGVNDVMDIDSLCNDIIAQIHDIDIEGFKEEDEDEDSRYHYEDYNEYNIEAIGEEIQRLVAPFTQKAIQLLRKGKLLDSVRVLLAIYEAQFLVEEPEWGDSYEEAEYAEIIATIFEEATEKWDAIVEEQTQLTTPDFYAAVELLLARWQTFQRFSKRAEVMPYQFWGEDLFTTLIEKAEAEALFFDFMSKNNLHTSPHYELTEMLCIALDKPEFLLERLEQYAYDSPDLTQELMQQHLNAQERERFVAVAKKGYEQFGVSVSGFIAAAILPSDDLVFFKKVLAEQAARKQDINLYERWLAEATESEHEAFIEVQKMRSATFYIQILNFHRWYIDILAFAEETADNLGSSAFESAAVVVMTRYPDAIFPLYGNRILKRMGSQAATRSHYQSVISHIAPMKLMPTKKVSLDNFIADLRHRFQRLPAFLDELKRAGF